MAVSPQQEIEDTVNTLRKTRLRIIRLIEQAYNEASDDETPLSTRLRVITVLTRALKDLGSNLSQLRQNAASQPAESEDINELFE